MKLETAIKILLWEAHLAERQLVTEVYAALNLGVEALKWRLLMEHDYGSWCGPPLPGETKD